MPIMPQSLSTSTDQAQSESSRSTGPPGEVRAPHREAGRGAEVEHAGGGRTSTILTHPPDTTGEARCLLCPLCRRHSDCRGWPRG